MTSEDSRSLSDPRSGRADDLLAPVITLSVCLSLGALFIVGPLLWQVVPVTRLPAPFPSHHQDAETLIYIVAFALLLPAGVISAARISDRISAGPCAPASSAVAGMLGAGLALVVIVTRVSVGGPPVLAAGAAVWSAAAAAVLVRSASSRPWEAATAIARHAATVWAVAGVLLIGVVLSFADLDSISASVLVVGAIAVALVLLVHERIRPPTLPRWLGLVVDLVLVGLILLAVPNLSPLASGVPPTSLDLSLTQFHQNFYLGPANQILAGDAMLVDVISQYGVGSIYFLAGAFTVIPISNGTLGLVEGLLSALMFIGTFVTLRVAGVTRLVAATTMAVAVTVLVYGLEHPLGALLQHGALRFGLPIGVVVGAVAEARWPRAAVPARLFQLLTVAVAAVWALEAFAYTLLTVIVIAVFRAATLPSGRGRELGRWAAQLAAAIVFAHLLLAAGTLAATEELPDWSWYLNTLRQFLLGDLGDWTFDFSTFSPGLAVGALYLASASALSLIVMRRRDLVLGERPLLTGIAGMTGYGVALYTYIVNRGADHIIPYVSLPVLALAALWLTLVGRPQLDVSTAGRRIALGSALALSALLVAVAWSTVEVRYPQSALAHAVPGGESLAAARERLWNPAPLRPEAAVGEELLAQRMPGESRSIVLTSADLSVEILLRAERGSAVPLGDPWEDSFVPEQHLDPLQEFVDGLDGGELMLLDGPGRRAFDGHRLQPGLDPLATGGDGLIESGAMASLQEWVLKEIGLRFDLRTVALTEEGLEVVQLVPREGG